MSAFMTLSTAKAWGSTSYSSWFPSQAITDLLLMYNSGPPGVGKTLTAETLAETFKAPLYTVCTMLGDSLPSLLTV